MKKNKIIITTLSVINLALFLSLLITVTPKQIPVAVNIYEKIIAFGSKWIMLISIILPVILLVPFFTVKDEYIKFILASIIIFCIYENTIAFSYFIAEKSILIETTSKIPISISIFLPISLFLFAWGSKIKYIPYKHKLGFNTKHSSSTEFIWKQTHITASYSIMLVGLVTFVASIVFVFARFPLALLGIFLLLMTLIFINLHKQSKFMANKNAEMKKRQENINKK